MDDATEYYLIYGLQGTPSLDEISKIKKLFKHLKVKPAVQDNTAFSVNGYFYDVREAWKQLTDDWSLNYDSRFIDEFMDR